MKIPDKLSATSSNKNSIIIVIILILAVVFLIIWFVGASGRFVLRTIDYVVQNLVQVSGMSHFLVKGLVILATIPFFWAVAKYTKTIIGFRRLRPSLKLYTNPYGMVIVVYVAIFFLAMYFASRDAYFYKYCCETPEGIRVLDSPGVDPVYGIECKPCTREQIISLRRQQGKLFSPRQITVDDPKTFEFFDPLTGSPKVWYFSYPEGNYELYDKPGKHPRTGKPLIPVDSIVVTNLIRIYKDRLSDEDLRKNQEVLGKYLNTSIFNKNNSIETAVIILREGNGRFLTLESAVIELLKARGIHSEQTLFKSSFFKEGMFQALMKDDWTTVKLLNLGKRVDYVILGETEVSYKVNPNLDNLKTASLRINLKCLNVTTQAVHSSKSLLITGAGFSEENALETAVKNAYQQLESYISAAF